MSKELRKKAWVALRWRFESAANQYSCLRCVLIHVQEDCRDKLVDPSMLASSSRPYQFWYTSVYSTGRFLYDKEGNSFITATAGIPASRARLIPVLRRSCRVTRGIPASVMICRQ